LTNELHPLQSGQIEIPTFEQENLNIICFCLLLRMSQLEDFDSYFSLKGKVAVVTGGSRGLGLHAATGYDLGVDGIV
jgi:hypothetical protein